MKVRVNGKEYTLEGISTVQELLDYLKLDCSRVAVEVNRKIVGREQYPVVKLSDGDVVEIVRFVGGG